MADVKWIKLATGLPDNRKIKQIRKLPNGDSIALMWIFLMCLAGDTNDDGMVYFMPEIPYTDEMLAEQFNIDVNTVRLGLATFQRFGMIEIVDDIICLSSWEKWQSTDKLSEMREKTRLRVAKHREKQRLAAGNVTCSVTVTPSNAVEEDKEEEREEEGEKEDILVAVPAEQPVKKRSRAFRSPTVEEVRDYCNERKNGVDPEAFVDFYESKGWIVGKTKMKDWKAAVRTWERSEGRGVKSNGWYHKSTVKSNAGGNTPTEGMGTWL